MLQAYLMQTTNLVFFSSRRLPFAADSFALCRGSRTQRFRLLQQTKTKHDDLCHKTRSPQLHIHLYFPRLPSLTSLFPFAASPSVPFSEEGCKGSLPWRIADLPRRYRILLLPQPDLLRLRFLLCDLLRERQFDLPR